MPPKRRRAIAVQPHVGLPDGELFRRAGALLHHAFDLAVAIAQDASVTGGIVHQGSQDCACGSGGLLGRDQAFERLRTHQRAVAVKNHEPAVQARERVRRHHQRMAGAFLFGLLDEADAKADTGRLNGRAHLGGLMAHHHKNSLGRRQCARGAQYVLDQVSAAGAVQHLGFARLHAGAQPGCENHYRQRCFHYFLPPALSLCRRPSCASRTATAAVSAGSWRTFLDSCSSLPLTTLIPILRDSVEVVFHGQRLLPFVALPCSHLHRRDVDNRAIDDLAAGMLVDGADMVGGGEVHGFSGLPHQVYKIRLEGGRTPDGRGDSLHQQVWDHAGEQRTGAQRDQVGLSDSGQRIGHGLHLAGAQPYGADDPAALADVGFSGDARAVLQGCLQRHIGCRGGVDPAGDLEHFGTRFDGLGKVAHELRQGR